jgi:hypothetical protein
VCRYGGGQHAEDCAQPDDADYASRAEWRAAPWESRLGKPTNVDKSLSNAHPLASQEPDVRANTRRNMEKHGIPRGVGLPSDAPVSQEDPQ